MKWSPKRLHFESIRVHLVASFKVDDPPYCCTKLFDPWLKISIKSPSRVSCLASHPENTLLLDNKLLGNSMGVKKGNIERFGRGIGVDRSIFWPEQKLFSELSGFIWSGNDLMRQEVASGEVESCVMKDLLPAKLLIIKLEILFDRLFKWFLPSL